VQRSCCHKHIHSGCHCERDQRGPHACCLHNITIVPRCGFTARGCGFRGCADGVIRGAPATGKGGSL
jgi:hypothetical protein